jgi:hypothetical protein
MSDLRLAERETVDGFELRVSGDQRYGYVSRLA